MHAILAEYDLPYKFPEKVDKDSVEIPDSDDITQPACEDLSVETCQTREDCVTIRGQLIDVENMCIDSPGIYGCMDADQACNAAITSAQGPDGKCYQFSSGCLPKGWSSAGNDSTCNVGYIDEMCNKLGLPCEKYTGEECMVRCDCRVIEGRKIDTERNCIGGSEPLGCMEVGMGCGDAETLATDPSDVCYWFSSTCIPCHALQA